MNLCAQLYRSFVAIYRRDGDIEDDSLTTDVAATIVHISVTDGHHMSYRDLFLRLLDGKPSTGPIRGRRFWKLVFARRIFFATIDTDYAGFIAVALMRAVLLKPTVGLFLRPLQCFRTERTIIYPMKRRVFRWLCRLPKLRLFSIIPHDIHPELHEISHDWIHDPQMWDLWIDGQPDLPETDLSRRVEMERGDREVMIYIGAANGIKGFPELVETAKTDSRKLLVVVAGSVPPNFRATASDLRAMGMIVEDRYVSDDEILSLYRIADFAWCRYAPDYDQASGVFGRAFQTGVMPVMRKGSFIEKLFVSRNATSIPDILESDITKIRGSLGNNQS
ncbi:hypothetical protein AB9F26_11345 [Falsihalocynthiibacter sp. BN13B15]|uniref:hypothetical protein n=1 Tax=Falsihalocynthiibacter sp. BN13B15 TaxID=3240871 RepID=UPI0035107A4C